MGFAFSKPDFVEPVDPVGAANIREDIKRLRLGLTSTSDFMDAENATADALEAFEALQKSPFWKVETWEVLKQEVNPGSLESAHRWMSAADRVRKMYVADLPILDEILVAEARLKALMDADPNIPDDCGLRVDLDREMKEDIRMRNSMSWKSKLYQRILDLIPGNPYLVVENRPLLYKAYEAITALVT